ncbi:hypothetical protein ZOSMA_8G00940 [Zostera marina]|uniref:Growth-regulating factor n=1 Tax=Zostera marina TaxID=29655 RepID=A0A0K9NJK3_ZOSMR|nr:hypothetical protein ZOSMA_8G00940 [Zostera marina]
MDMNVLVGSGFLKHGGRLETEHEEEEQNDEEERWRKMARCNGTTTTATTEDGKEKESLLRSNNNNSSTVFFDSQQMLSFASSPNGNTFPYHHHHLLFPPSSSSSSSYGGSSGEALGFGSGWVDLDMHGRVMCGAKSFTPSQWMELEHQATIYKCLDAKVPVPPSLLFSIQKGATPNVGYTGYSPASFRPTNTFGWGSLPVRFSNGGDPEPGRCRRTDGKKWRCSRDAVVDQKYCERHLNRGRHRSRKPVEGQPGHGKTIMAATSSEKETKPSSATPFHRRCSDARTQQISFLEETSRNPNFGLLGKSGGQGCEEPPRQKKKKQPAPQSQPPPQQQQSSSFRHFMDAWSKNQSDRPATIWPDVEQTQLSISIPNSSLDPVEIQRQEENWAPISWEAAPSMGGPLGEALNGNSISKNNNTANTTLNLLTYGWDSNSSPTGVLQKTAFGSLSNSTANSPRAGSHCDEPHSRHMGLDLQNSSSMRL